MLEEARVAMADFLNAASPHEIVFGNNMTSLTLHVSRSLARSLGPADEIVVTRLDHDANISPWLLIAEDRGCKVTWVDFDVEDGTLRWRLPGAEPKIVAFGMLNAREPSTRRALARMAKAGALVTWRGSIRATRSNRRARPGLRFPGVLGVQVLRSPRRHPVRATGPAERAQSLQGEAGLGRASPQV
jgi:hypothetical protein